LLSIKELKDGDEYYFRKVFDQYHQKLYFFILYKTRSEYIAEEVVQMAFTKLWQCRRTLQEEKGIDSTTEKMRGAELQKKISEAVNDLPPVRKQVFEMSREQGMTYREIAETLCVSSKTVETHIYKALKQIKKHISVVID
jgi:DNA-directed RNA polymerase specialized sigma24 family protein